MTSSIEKALHRLVESPLFERATIGSTEATTEGLVIAAAEIETAFSQDRGGWRVQCGQFMIAAAIMLRPQDAVSAFMLDATASHTARVIANTPDESLAAVWATIIETAKAHHNRRGAKDEWKLILWAVNAGWGTSLGAEPERKRG